MNIRRHVMNMATVSVESTSFSRLDLNPTNNHNIVVGLNGALQKRFILQNGQKLVPGDVHRASRVDFGVGGKGQDVAIALRCLQEQRGLSGDGETDDDEAAAASNESSSNNIRLVQFVGTGFAGDTVHNLLNDRLGEETMEFTVRSSSEMRTCTSIVAADETTELVEPSGIITNDELEELFSIIPSNQNGISKERCLDSLCIMGSMPPGVPEDTYARIYAQLAGPNTVCVVDSLAGIGPLLQTISEFGNRDGKAITVGPVLFKMNASELCKLAGTPKSNNEADGISVSEMIDAIEGFMKKYLIGSTKNDPLGGVIGLAITDGKHDAYFVNIGNMNSQEDQTSPSQRFKVFQLPVPNLENYSPRALYPIGAGDAVAAGTVAAWASLATKDVTTTTFSSIPEDSLASSIVLVDRILDHCSKLTMELSPIQAQALAAFAFGLACGSASCLQEQNSVLDVGDVNRLFKETSRSSPKPVSTS